MRHEFVRKAVRAVQGNLALLRRIARAARKMATDRQADVLTAQQEKLLLETFTLRSCVLRKGILPGLYAALALTFGWLAVDVFPLQLPVPAGLTVAMAQKRKTCRILAMHGEDYATPCSNYSASGDSTQRMTRHGVTRPIALSWCAKAARNV